MQLIRCCIVNALLSSIGVIDQAALAVSVHASTGHSKSETKATHYRRGQHSKHKTSVPEDHAEVNSRGHVKRRQRPHQAEVLASHESVGQLEAPSKGKLEEQHGIQVYAQPLSFLEEGMETTRVRESDETVVDDQPDPVPFPPTRAPSEGEVTEEVTVKVTSQGMEAAEAQLSEGQLASEVASQAPVVVDTIQQTEDKTVNPSSSATLQVSSLMRRETNDERVKQHSDASVSAILSRWLAFTQETAEELQETLGIPYVKGIWSVLLPLCVVALLAMSVFYSCSKRSLVAAKGEAGRVESISLACMPQCASSRKTVRAKDANDDGAESLWLALEEVPVSGPREVEELLPAESGYDLAFSRTLSSRKLVRIQARIEGPVEGAEPLIAPITQLPCVLYLASASRKVHAGILPLPLAYSSKQLNFTVALHDVSEGQRRDLSVCVSGAEVMLFAKHSCRFSEVLPFPCAQDRWQDFVTEHSTGNAEGKNSGLHQELLATGAAVEFQECALVVGADVTLVGELIRSPDGVLSLHPLSQEASWASKQRAESTELEPPDSDALAKARSQVLVSDDPRLLKDA